MKLALYYTLFSCSTVPYINLTEAGAEFETVALNFRNSEHHAPAYLKLNPKHKVPTLVIDGEPLTEIVAINLWIARQFPNAGLLPDDPWQETKAISLMTWFASSIHPALATIVNPRRHCDLPDSEESLRRCAQKLLDEYFTIAEGLLAGREWLFDRFGAVDSYFFWNFNRATQLELKFLDMAKFRHCMAHRERMGRRPSVHKYRELERQTAERFAQAA